KRGDGTEIAAEMSVKLIKDMDATFVTIIMRDVSERLKAEEAIREAHDKLEATVKAIPDILFEVDREGRIYDYHSPMHGALYASPEAFLGKKVGEVLPAEATEVILKAIAQADRVGWHVGSSYVLDMPTGRQWFELSIEKKGKDKTNRDRFVVLVRDITKRKKAEEALRESEVRFRTAFDQAGSGMGMATLDGTLIKVNDAYCRMLGYKREEMVGRKTVAFTHPDDMAITLKTFEQLASLERTSVQYEKRYIRKDGTQIFAFINVSAIYDADGKPAYVLAQIQDMTERKRLEDELRKYTEHLEELVKEKTRQLQEAQRLATIGETATMVGHDLRNPLQAIINLTFIMNEILDNAPPFPGKEKVRQAQMRIERNVDYMNKIVTDLTDFARPL
ncbi:MAG TPA: PAS domain S-box protein, partial [Candidatus Methanomethylicus sp.]|nr:PAS domain S-box protein [Candidatus Methanomethylicus sp.]